MIEKDGQPWFVAADVCAALEIGNPSQAIARVDDDERMTTLISNEGAATGKSQMAFVNEPGLYSLVLGSRKPEAKTFKRWITHEVIPTIRKHGIYATPEAAEAMLNNPDVMIQALQALKQEREERERLAEKVKADAPKVLFATAVEGSTTSILVGELAKLLRQNGVEIGANRLFEWLRENGYLIRRKGAEWNMPTQRAMELGLFEIRETVINRPESAEIRKTTKVTGKGQQYFIRAFLNQ